MTKFLEYCRDPGGLWHERYVRTLTLDTGLIDNGAPSSRESGCGWEGCHGGPFS